MTIQRELDAKYFCEKALGALKMNSVEKMLWEMSIAIHEDVDSLEPWFDYDAHHSKQLRMLKSFTSGSNQLSEDEKDKAKSCIIHLFAVCCKIENTEAISQTKNLDRILLWKETYYSNS